MKYTVVSFLPIAVPSENKPGLYPGSFAIKASDGKRPQILHVGPSLTYVYLDENRGSLPVRVAADEVARSIVEDYCKSVPNYIHGVASPALFCVPGELTEKEVFEKHKSLCVIALEMQKQWFVELVKSADDTWQKFKQHRMISALDRFAAQSINAEREWNIEKNTETHTKCQACQSVVSIEAVLCSACRFVLKPEEYKKMQFAKEG